MEQKQTLSYMINGNHLPDNVITASRMWVQVGDIVNPEIFTIKSTSSLQEAADRMDKKKVSSLLVVEKKKKIGILSERDLTKGASRPDWKDLRAKDIMNFPITRVESDISILEASIMMSEKNIRRLIVTKKGKDIGIVTETDLTRSLSSYGVWNKVKNMMKTKLVTISHNSRISSAAKKMTEKKISCILIKNKGSITGILTERDIIRKILSKNIDPKNTPVRSVMSSPLAWIEENASVFCAARLMEKLGIRRLVVRKGKKIIGIITFSDIFRYMKTRFQKIDDKHKQNIETSEHGIYTTDRSGNITYVNSFLLKLLKIRREDIIGKKFLPSKYFSIRPKHKLYTRTYTDKELYLKDSKGNRVNVLLTSTFTKDSHGKTNGTHGIIRDITVRREVSELKIIQEKLLESDKRFKAILEGSNEGIICIDMNDMRPLYANKKIFRLLGPRSKVLSNISPGKNNSIMLNSRYGTISLRRGKQELSFGQKDKIHLETHSKLIRLEKKNILVGFIRDITRQKKNKQDMKERKIELEKEVARRSKELILAYEEIQHLLMLKSQFISQLAHDLRTPLTPINALLPSIIRKEKNSKNRTMLKIIMSNAKYLADIVKESLNISMLDNGVIRFSIKPVDIYDIVKNSLKKKEMEFAQNNIIAANKVDKNNPKVLADSLRIEEVIDNIISNALRYMKDKDRKKNRLTVTSELEEKHVKISIKDTGAGIEKEHLKKIFDEFYRADPSRHEYSSGLGLAICKRIIKRHKGDIWAESKGPGRGATFHFTIPRGDIDDKSIDNR